MPADSPTNGGYTCEPSSWIGHVPSPVTSRDGPAARSSQRTPQRLADGTGLGGQLPGRDAECSGVGPAVVLGQDLAEIAGPVCDGAVADLATGDRKVGNGHREAAGT